MLTLYQFPISHYCEKVRWVLEYKNLAYKKVNLLPGLHTRKSKKLASTYTLPILVDGKKIIHESSEIITYLDKSYPDNPVTPTSKEELALSQKWESFADDKIGADVRSLCYHTLLDHPDLITPYFTQGGPWYGKLYMKVSYPKLANTMRKLMKLDDAAIKEINSRLTSNIEKLHQHYQKHEFCVGNRFGRADIANAALLAPLCKTRGYGVDWPENFPEPLHSTVKEFGNKLDWVYRIYNEYR